MIIDLNKVDQNPFIEKMYDVCICGAGVAGITLALKLSPKLDVVLLEGGGLEYTDDSQDIYKGKSVGEEYYDLTTARLRYFGGTSNYWGGWCHPLDSYDFTPKPYVEHSGWPIERRDLDPYLEEAESILDITQDSVEGQSPSQEDLGDAIATSEDFQRIGFKWSAPTRFGQKYRDAINRKPGLACYVNANVVDMKLFENLSKLKQVEVRSFSGKSFKVRARTFVLAAGGIENPRILLNCNRQMTGGLGNDNGLVGRFFTEHLNKTVGRFILEDRAKQNLLKNWIDVDPAYKNARYFSPSPGFMEREQILNFGIFVEPDGRPDGRPSDRRGFKEVLRGAICGSEWIRGAVETVRGKPMWCRPSLGHGRVRIVSEQALNASSRVSLGSDVDRFGMRRVVLDWKLSEIDKRTMQRAVFRLGKVFAKLGLGRVKIHEWLLSEEIEVPGGPLIAGRHHMCTTRMSKTRHDGVVDSNQRLFGVDNLYVGGSSVFSTAGHDSPTITIVQMTLRLADHLEEILEAQAG